MVKSSTIELSYIELLELQTCLLTRMHYKSKDFVKGIPSLLNKLWDCENKIK